jgi:succinate dehydrogenase / fumarate reductase iron-sulfur subunit
MSEGHDPGASGGSGGGMRITLQVWRQKRPDAPGALETYAMSGVSPDMSFLEMLDVVNERLMHEGKEPIAFDHDCREGICGSCGFMINGQAHGPERATATCQLHMRKFHDGDHITIEPWRAAGFPLVKDLIVDRTEGERGECVTVGEQGLVRTPELD